MFGGIAAEDTLTSVMRTTRGARRIRVYAPSPDVVDEVGTHFGRRTQTIGSRFPFDVSAQP